MCYSLWYNAPTMLPASGRQHRHTTGTFLFISHTTNILLFKFRCNVFIGVRIIKEMPGSVASGTPCITLNTHSSSYKVPVILIRI